MPTMLLLLFLFQAAAATLEPRQADPSPIRVLRGDAGERNLQAVNIVRLALINADTNQEIQTVALETDGTISLDDLPSANLSIEAIVEGSVSKVELVHDNGVSIYSRREKRAPYSLCGEGKNGSFRSCDALKEGTHSVTAIALVGKTPVVSRTATFTRKYMYAAASATKEACL